MARKLNAARAAISAARYHKRPRAQSAAANAWHVCIAHQLAARAQPLSFGAQNHRRTGAKLCDLTASNPTTCGFACPEQEILAALADPRVLTYRPESKGLREGREAVANYYRGRAGFTSPESQRVDASADAGRGGGCDLSTSGERGCKRIHKSCARGNRACECLRGERGCESNPRGKRGC